MKAIIGHIILNVKDFHISETFYDPLMTTMGFVINHVDEGVYGKMKSYKQGAHNLWIRYDKQKQSEQFNRDVGLDHLAFEMEKCTEVDRLYELVVTLDVKITRTPKKYPEYTETYYALFFRDPDGIPLEIYKG